VLKPSENTPQAFGILVEEQIHKIGYIGKQGPLKSFAVRAHVTPTRVSEIIRGTFPGRPKSDSENAKTQWEKGRAGTVLRICQELGLDGDACLAACGLNMSPGVIQLWKQQGKLELNRSDLKKLLDYEALFGPISYLAIPSIVESFRSKPVADSE
jgi:hypothetical protein